MNYWHIQLFPGRENKPEFPSEKIREILMQTHYIGIGENWNETIEGQFKEALQIGDLVLVRSNGPLALCKVVGDLEHKDNANPDFDWFPNRRKIEILGWIEDYEKYIGRSVDNIYSPITFAPANNCDFIKKWHSTISKNKAMKDMQKLLETNKNLILTGAPGTGKTYLARQIAKAMNAEIGFVQFHPSYDYTDFVEGLRPTKSDENGNIGFELKDGLFRMFCKKAEESLSGNAGNLDKTTPFVFIIDEINRGEISKIFGELFFSLDPSYRGKEGAVKTQYSNMRNGENKEFYVPENVYIIGTMNDIDRSVESFDFAMRRRFVWREITAEQSADNMGLPEEIKNRMARLNAEISKIDGLNASYHIGGAYFLDKEAKARTDYVAVWELRLEPLLREYLRGMPNAEDKLKQLKNAYDAKPDNGQ